jgi:hypothetical protein
MVTMSLLGYVWAFLAGAFLANGVPHFVMGVCGMPFPTPFAKSPGEGDSSPVVNVVWGFANFAVGVLLLHFHAPQDLLAWALLGVGALLLAVMLAWHFGKVQAKK